MSNKKRTKLTLVRKPGQTIEIPQCGITITLVKSGSMSGRTEIAVEAPQDIQILRGELTEQANWNRLAAAWVAGKLNLHDVDKNLQFMYEYAPDNGTPKMRRVADAFRYITDQDYDAYCRTVQMAEMGTPGQYPQHDQTQPTGRSPIEGFEAPGQAWVEKVKALSQEEFDQLHQNVPPQMTTGCDDHDWDDAEDAAKGRPHTVRVCLRCGKEERKMDR